MWNPLEDDRGTGCWWCGDDEGARLLWALDQSELEKDLGSWMAPQLVIPQGKVGDFTGVSWTKVNEMGKVCDGEWIRIHGMVDGSHSQSHTSFAR